MAKNIWVDDNQQTAIDLDQVRHIYLCELRENEKNGLFKLCFEFVTEGFTQVVLQRFGKDDQGEAEEYATRDFNKVVEQWRGGAK